MDKQTIEEMINYIEDVEVEIEKEWGCCRPLKKLISDNAMPDLYNKLLKQRDNKT